MTRGYFKLNGYDPNGRLRKIPTGVFEVGPCGQKSKAHFDWETAEAANSGMVVQKIQLWCAHTACRDPWRAWPDNKCDCDCRAEWRIEPNVVYYEAWDLATERTDKWELEALNDWCGGYWVWAEARYYPRLNTDDLIDAGWQRHQYYGGTSPTCNPGAGPLLSISGEDTPGFWEDIVEGSTREVEFTTAALASNCCDHCRKIVQWIPPIGDKDRLWWIDWSYYFPPFDWMQEE